MTSFPIGAAPQTARVRDDKSAVAAMGCLFKNRIIGGTRYDKFT